MIFFCFFFFFFFSMNKKERVCKDHTGIIIKACSQISLPFDPNFNKALATLLAANLLLKNFTLEGDSLIEISALQVPSIANSLSIIPTSSSWEAMKININANFYTYHVAYWTVTRVHSCCILLFFSLILLPPFLL
jgi:hypothetical protein